MRRKFKKNSAIRNLLGKVNLWGWQTFPSIFSWNLSKNIIELNITFRCNLHCLNCNRSTKQAPAHKDISPEQVEHFIDETITENWKWVRIGLLGGEPTLHPQLFDILEILKRYKDFNPSCSISLVTNGYGKTIEAILSRLPEWLKVRNTSKNSSLHEFSGYNIAPIDLEEYRQADFSRGCFQTEICGIGMTKYGYYPCSPGADIDRVFGFNIGIKNLSSLNDRELRKQLKVLCAYCGHYRDNFGERKITNEIITRSWENAYRNYKKSPPTLSLFP